jgi:DNA-binding transcriptional LysR family regulator
MSMQHVSLRQLKVFEAAATSRSFSRAAEVLHLTQPGVSMHIKELEGHAGLPLFERIGRKVFVTEAGQELLIRAREVIRSLKDADDAFDGIKGLRRGRITLAVVSTAKYFAPRLLARFRDEFPQLEIRLAVSDRSSVIEQITSNAVDLAIIGRSPDTLDIEAHEFADNPHVIIAAPGHALAGKQRIGAATIAKQTFLVREPGSGTRLALEEFFEQRRLSYKIGMEMASNETIKQAVMADMGVSFLSRHTFELELQMGRLVVLDVDALPVIRHWQVAHLANKRLSPTANAFKTFLLARGRELLRGEAMVLPA